MPIQVSNELIDQWLRRTGGEPVTRVFINDTDVTPDVDREPVIGWRIEDPTLFGKFQANGLNFTLRSIGRSYAPFGADNFWSEIYSWTHGTQTPIRVEMGYTLDNTTGQERTYQFNGFVSRINDPGSINVSQGMPRTQVWVEALDPQSQLNRVDAHNLGFQVSGESWTVVGSEDWGGVSYGADTDGGLPVSKESWSGLWDDDPAHEITLRGQAKRYGAQDFPFGEMDYVNGFLTAEQEKPGSSYVAATYKAGYRDAEYLYLMRQLLGVAGITDFSEVLRPDLVDSRDESWFTLRGRFGQVYREDRLATCRAFAYNETDKILWAGINEKLASFSFDTDDSDMGIWVEQTSVSPPAGMVIVAMVIDSGDRLWAMFSSDPTGDICQIYRIDTSEGTASGTWTVVANTLNSYNHIPYDLGDVNFDPFLDWRRSFQVIDDGGETYVYFTYNDATDVECRRIVKSTLAVQTVKAITKAAWADIEFGYNFIVDKTPQYVYHFLIGDDGTYLKPAQCEIRRTDLDGTNDTLLFRQEYAAVPYPFAALDLAYMEDGSGAGSDQIWIVCHEEQGGVFLGQWKLYTFEVNSPAVTAQISPGTPDFYQRNAPRSLISPADNLLYYATGDHFFTSEDYSGNFYTWTYSPGAGDFNATALGRIFYHENTGKTSGISSNLLWHPDDETIHMVGWGQTSQSDAFPFVGSTAVTRDYYNGHHIQWGTRLAMVAPVLNPNDQKVWDVLQDIALASGHEMGFNTDGTFFSRERPRTAPVSVSGQTPSDAATLQIDTSSQTLTDPSSFHPGWLATKDSSGNVEILQYASFSTSGTITSVWSLDRGLHGTSAQTIADGQGVYPCPFLTLNDDNYPVLVEVTDDFNDVEAVINTVKVAYGDFDETIDASFVSEGTPFSETQFGQRELSLSTTMYDNHYQPHALELGYRIQERFRTARRYDKTSLKWLPHAELGTYTVLYSQPDSIPHTIGRVEAISSFNERRLTQVEIREES